MSQRASDLISVSRVGDEAWLEYNVNGLRLRVEMNLEELQSLISVCSNVNVMLIEHLKPSKPVRRWLPELSSCKGSYANLIDTSITIDKSGRVELWPQTFNPTYARKFETKEECVAWCEGTLYTPVEYDFGE